MSVNRIESLPANADRRIRLSQSRFRPPLVVLKESKMDVSQITSLAIGLANMDLSSKVSTMVLKKSLDNQQSMAAGILNSIPQLPANPAVGRNINTTA
jgi:hypothetical protein